MSSYYFHKFENDKPHNQLVKLSTIYKTVNSFEINKNQYLFQSGYNLIQNKSFQTLSQTNLEPFPFSEIIGLRFEEILKTGSISIIEPYLVKMLHHKFTTSSNSSLVILLSSFQYLLKYLFQLQSNLNKTNIELETSINSESSWINQQITSKEKRICDNNNLRLDLKMKKDNIKQRIVLFKSVLYSSGFQKLIPNSGPLKIKHGNSYYCDVCPNKKFLTYENAHSHYVKYHFKGVVNNFNQSNEEFQKLYFDSKLDIMKEELLQTLNCIKFPQQLGLSIRKANNQNKDPFYQTKKQERIIQPLKSSCSSDIKTNATINHYPQKIQRSTIRQNTVADLCQNNFKESINMEDIMNQLESKHENNIKDLIFEMNKFKQDICKELNILNNRNKNSQSIVFKQRNLKQNNNYQKNTIKSINSSNIINNIDSTKSIPLNVESDDQSIKNPDQLMIEYQTISKPPLPNDSISQVAPYLTKFEEIIIGVYDKFMKREENYMNNNNLKSLEEIVKEYNVFNLNLPILKIENLNKEIEKRCEKRDFIINKIDYSSDKTPYESIINTILINNTVLSKNDFIFAKHQEVIYCMTELKKIINHFGDNIKNKIYLDIDLIKSDI